MKTTPNESSSRFYSVLAALAMLTPIFLVIAAGTLPQGARGDLIVFGHEVLLAVIAAALALRIAFVKGSATASSRLPNRSATA